MIEGANFNSYTNLHQTEEIVHNVFRNLGFWSVMYSIAESREMLGKSPTTSKDTRIDSGGGAMFLVIKNRKL